MDMARWIPLSLLLPNEPFQVDDSEDNDDMKNVRQDDEAENVLS